MMMKMKCIDDVILLCCMVSVYMYVNIYYVIVIILFYYKILNDMDFNIFFVRFELRM